MDRELFQKNLDAMKAYCDTTTKDLHNLKDGVNGLTAKVSTMHKEIESLKAFIGTVMATKNGSGPTA